MGRPIPQPIERLQYEQRPATIAEAIVRFTPDLLDGAEARTLDFDGSWRHFDVGNGSLATDEKGDFFAVFGENYKAEGKQPACAERVAVYRAEQAGLRIHSFHVDAEVQPDTASGLKYPTLHPCGQWCRHSEHTMKHEAVVDNPTVVTRRRGTGIHQVFNAVELDSIHEDPLHYGELGNTVIDDPGYYKLGGVTVANVASLQTGAPNHPRLSDAVVIRTAWTAAAPVLVEPV